VCDDNTAHDVAIAQVAEAHVIMVIVNSTEYGGSGGHVATMSTSISPPSAEIALHEMGHQAFGFADEYDCYTCDPSETGHDHYTGGDPNYPNVTTVTDPASIKWKATLTAATDPLPTTSNDDCSASDPQANPRSATYVGAYEGAYYFHCGCYRPSYTCRMKELGVPFCLVCQQHIRDTLQPFIPAGS
jgi:hypothetical protein